MHMNKRVRGDVCLILCGVLVWFLADAKQLRPEAADNGWRPIWLA